MSRITTQKSCPIHASHFPRRTVRFLTSPSSCVAVDPSPSFAITTIPPSRPAPTRRSMSKEDKIKEDKNQKMFKRLILTLVALAVLGVSALMVQDLTQQDGAVVSSLGGMSKSSLGGVSSMRMGSKMQARSSPVNMAAAQEFSLDALEADGAYASSRGGTMGRDILQALDESMKQIPQHDKVDRMLVHNGYLSLQAWKGSLQTMADNVEKLITKENRGYVESRSSSNQGWNDDDKRLIMDMQFRIQSQYFHETIASIQELVGQDMVMSVNVNSRDVTDSYIDATSRADTLEASMKALRTLLERANNVNEIIEVQRELNSLTQQYESQRKLAVHLQKEANYSYLSVHWEEKIPRMNVVVGWRPSRAFFLAWSHMLAFGTLVGDTLIYSMVWTVPLVVASLVYFSCFRKK